MIVKREKGKREIDINENLLAKKNVRERKV